MSGLVVLKPLVPSGVFDRPASWIEQGYISREQAGDARLSATLEAGDVLYLPRGCSHVPRADSFSLHLIVGIHTLTLREFLLALMSHTAFLPTEFDQTIPFATVREAPLQVLLHPAIDALFSQLGQHPRPRYSHLAP
jgi:ribosomal protein L16 Arg81 hydroxylase